MNYKLLIVLVLVILLLTVMGGTIMGKDNEFIIDKNKQFWNQKLTGEQYNVLVEGGTELACQNEYYNNKRQGIYVCAACNNILFSSGDKYNSGSGWPSFYDVVSEDAIGTRKDKSLTMERTELYCNKCGGHLGHVFEDGPEPTGLRYCINSNALNFLQEAYFALGCFWKPDAFFGSIDGVYFVDVGYAGGEMENPTYRDLGKHAETIHVIYDPELISYVDLLDAFWQNHSPTTQTYSNQYRSIIFYSSEEQQDMAKKYLENKKTEAEKDIYTEILPVENYTTAEDYHQKYLLKSNDLLYKRLRGIFDTEEDYVKSILATKLNGYNSGFLTKTEIAKFLRNHYKYVDYSERIEKIIGELQNKAGASCNIVY